MIAATDTVVREETALATALDEELILLDVENGKYLTINPMGSAIWEALAGPVAVEALVETLAGRHDAPPDRIRHDVLAFLDILASRGFIRVVPA